MPSHWFRMAGFLHTGSISKQAFQGHHQRRPSPNDAYGVETKTGTSLMCAPHDFREIFHLVLGGPDNTVAE